MQTSLVNSPLIPPPAEINSINFHVSVKQKRERIIVFRRGDISLYANGYNVMSPLQGSNVFLFARHLSYGYNRETLS